MNNIKEIAFTCYPVLDMDRARKFYEGIIGLKPDSEPIAGEGGSMWIEYTIAGGTFSLGRMDGFVPSKDGASIGLEVEDLDAMVKKLRDNGVKFIFEPMETPVCHMAIVEDTEGNALIVHKRK